MSDLDMTVQHNNLTDQTVQMRGIAQRMKTDLEEIVAFLESRKEEFSGEAAVQFDEFAKTVNSVDGELSINFDAGARAIDEAHDIIKNGDRKSAFLFQR
ncbi:hypothetical protein [Streptomyces sp. NPDC090025]|uniref:hypothetical protein n=1 Tax=Streptomyces sp. NPDC090025 TaxID=3365922 RepID=UPI0038384CEC